MKAKTPKEILIAARWILDNIGWNKFEYTLYNDAGKPISYCAIGALREVEIDPVSGYTELYPAAKAHLADIIGKGISFWNDEPTRTKEEVLEAFDKAIESCE